MFLANCFYFCVTKLLDFVGKMGASDLCSVKIIQDTIAGQSLDWLFSRSQGTGTFGEAESLGFIDSGITCYLSASLSLSLFFLDL